LQGFLRKWYFFGHFDTDVAKDILRYFLGEDDKLVVLVKEKRAFVFLHIDNRLKREKTFFRKFLMS